MIKDIVESVDYNISTLYSRKDIKKKMIVFPNRVPAKTLTISGQQFNDSNQVDAEGTITIVG